MSETDKPEAGEPSEDQIAQWWEETYERFYLSIPKKNPLTDETRNETIDAALKNQSVRPHVAFARRLWREARERAIEEAALLAEHLGCAPRVLSGTNKSVAGCGAEVAFAIRALAARKP